MGRDRHTAQTWRGFVCTSCDLASVGDFAQIEQFAQAGYDATMSSFA